MPTSAYANRTLAVTLTGTPTQVAWPAGFPSNLEVWASCPTAWNFRFVAADPGFPIAAGTVVRLPTSTRALLVDGAGTLSLAVFGDAS